jgi:hypothetical protein
MCQPYQGTMYKYLEICAQFCIPFYPPLAISPTPPTSQVSLKSVKLGPKAQKQGWALQNHDFWLLSFNYTFRCCDYPRGLLTLIIMYSHLMLSQC